MSSSYVQLIADVRSANPAAIRALLGELVDGTISETPTGLHVEGRMVGTEPREVNRQLLSALRSTERRTTLRAEWTFCGVIHRFFDCVPKGTRAVSSDS